MRILLIYPSHREINSPLLPRSTKTDFGIKPPLGLLYIASSLKKCGFNGVKVIDGQVLKDEDREIMDIVKTYRPDCIGISALTLTLFRAARMARAIKEIDSRIHITFGGPHVTVYPLETLSFPYVDSVVPDEGEITYPELVMALDGGKLPYGVKGVYFKDKRKIVTNEKRELIKKLDFLPFPDKTQLDKNNYFFVSNKAEPSTTLISSRGCPYKCIFCCSPHELYRQRSPYNVVDEMEECMKNGIRIFNFMDDIFNLTKKKVVGISREIIRRNLKIEWTFVGRVDVMDREMLEIARESGLVRIFFGIESGSDEILKYLKKGFTAAEAQSAVSLCKDLGISVTGLFVLGTPYETQDQVKKTVRLACELDLDAAQFFPLLPGPGTELYRKALEARGFDRDYFHEYAVNPDGPPPLRYWETTFTEKEILDYMRQAFRQFYMRPSFLFNSLKRLSSMKEAWRQMKSGFSLMKFALGF